MIKGTTRIELPKELKSLKVKKPTLISWVIEIDTDSVVQDYYRTFSYYKKHMYWEKSRDNFYLYGVETLDTHFQDINTNSQLKGTGPIELTADLFDSRTDSQKEWQNLSQPVNYLPKILRTEINNKQYVTLNFVVTEKDSMVSVWQEQMALWERFVKIEDNSDQKTNEVSSQKECHVKDWLNSVETSVDMIKESEKIEKIVLARQLKVSTKNEINISSVLSNLRNEQPNTYRFVVRNNQEYFVGATPERLLEATETHFSTVCVAGSIKRGETPLEDEKLGNELLKDTKNILEHNYVVKWLTSQMKELTTELNPLNDVKLLKNRDIQHLFLPITGKRKQHISFKESIKKLHPSPALGGLPKKAAIDWIKDHEKMPRGLYGGPLGWNNLQTDVGEVVVGIRSGLISGNKALLYAGCGIVKESEAELEREETKVKFQPMLRALGGNINE